MLDLVVRDVVRPSFRLNAEVDAVRALLARYRHGRSAIPVLLPEPGRRR